MVEMTPAEKLEYEYYGIYLGEGSWAYEQRDLDLVKSIAIAIRSHPYQPEGGIEIEPPMRRPWDTTVNPDPLILVRYQKGSMQYEAKFQLNLIYDQFLLYEVEQLIWGQFPNSTKPVVPVPGPDPTASIATGVYQPFGLRVDKFTIV